MARAVEYDKPGDEMLLAYIRQEAARLQRAGTPRVTSAGDWDKLRREYRRQLLDMLGLWPMPKRTDLKPAVTGTLERKNFIVEKLHFQSLPHLYVTANLYRPRGAAGRGPAVLYLCGHAGRGRDGNKTAYQHHAIWFATHGYVCLILDSLQLGEIAGTHHGTHGHGRWWWHSRGYTPAGVECLNGIRAIDYLQTRGDVDAGRIAVTGRSGGGAYSFWIAATDDRVKAAAATSGLTDLEEYVTPAVLNGHCDCMFMYNTHRWPMTRVAELIRPRPLLYGNCDKDKLFPMAGNRRVIERLRKFYDAGGRADRVDAFVAKGRHKDAAPLRKAAFRWINRWLKGDDSPVKEPVIYPKIPGKDLRVFTGDLPADEINTSIDRTFVPVARVKVPAGGDRVRAIRRDLLAGLRKTTFGAWPGKYPAGKLRLGAKPAAGTYATAPPIEVAYRYVPGPGRAGRGCWSCSARATAARACRIGPAG